VQRREMVDEYLQVLDLHDRELDYGFLCELAERHVATFAFGSVGCRLGEDLPLDFDSLFSRIVVRRRGGYCFEQNGFLYEVLEELGFSPELYLARVIYNQDCHPGLTHRISIVEHEGQRYVLDVGFGPLGPRVPVHMSASATNDVDRAFRVEEKCPGDYHMQVSKDGAFFSLYRFELVRYGQSDCELGHFYSHRHPDAAFVNHLVASRILASEIRSLRDLEYCVIRESEKQTTRIGDPQQLTRLLVEELGIRVTDAEGHRLFEGLDT
jgi:N-hydroxyarylamine O-acetyltransferase